MMAIQQSSERPHGYHSTSECGIHPQTHQAPPSSEPGSHYHRRALLHLCSRRTVLPTLKTTQLHDVANYDGAHRRPVQGRARRLATRVLARHVRPLLKTVLDGGPVERDDDDDEHQVDGLCLPSSEESASVG